MVWGDEDDLWVAQDSRETNRLILKMLSTHMTFSEFTGVALAGLITNDVELYDYTTVYVGKMEFLSGIHQDVVLKSILVCNSSVQLSTDEERYCCGCGDGDGEKRILRKRNPKG